MKGVPMTPTDYRQTMRGFELAAEYQAVQARIDAGHEFAALMAPGATVFLAGEWREIVTTIDEGHNRLTIVCTDCTEWLALRTATRPYRQPTTDEVER